MTTTALAPATSLTALSSLSGSPSGLGLHLAVSATYRRGEELLHVELDGGRDLVRGVLRTPAGALAWHALVAPTDNGTWAGCVVHDEGDPRLLPHTSVEVGLVRRSRLTGGRGSATATFSGGGVPTTTRTYGWACPLA